MDMPLTYNMYILELCVFQQKPFVILTLFNQIAWIDIKQKLGHSYLEYEIIQKFKYAKYIKEIIASPDTYFLKVIMTFIRRKTVNLYYKSIQ